MSPFKFQVLALAVSFRAANACAADNCYRALFPCPSPSAVAIASSFCATITANGVTATNYPTRATAACGTSAARYISACQCGPTCYPTTTLATSTASTSTCTPSPSNGGLIYGDFECGGFGPWATSTVDAGFAIAVQTPGLTGKKSVQGTFVGNSVCKDRCSAGRIDAATVSVTPGIPYKVTYATWMDGATSGFIGLMINGNGERTIDVGDLPTSQWNFIQHSWNNLLSRTTANVTLEWYGPAGRLDAITFAPLAAYCGPNPPIGIMPDGEFECGLGGWSQQVPDPGCTAGAISTDGLIPTNQGLGAFGQYAWQAISPTAPNPANQQQGVSARVISPALPVIPGKTYLLAFTAYFSARGIGFLGVKINDNPVMTRDPADLHQGILWFAPNQVFWTDRKSVV